MSNLATQVAFKALPCAAVMCRPLTAITARLACVIRMSLRRGDLGTRALGRSDAAWRRWCRQAVPSSRRLVLLRLTERGHTMNQAFLTSGSHSSAARILRLVPRERFRLYPTGNCYFEQPACDTEEIFRFWSLVLLFTGKHKLALIIDERQLFCFVKHSKETRTSLD